MLSIILLVLSVVSAQRTCDSKAFGKEFTSALNSYCVQTLPESGVYTTGNELYDRTKCTTCCRVMFVSDYNYKTQKQFKPEDDARGDTRFVMDEEFDNRKSVRMYAGSYEQNILLRPINRGNELQYWEFAPYKMYTAFAIPKRVHDIRGGAGIGITLIIWMKKPPLDAGTNNQRFVYVHPFPDSYYPEVGSKKDGWPIYKNHFYLPFYTGGKLCYSAEASSARVLTWTGNSKLKVIGDSYQITTRVCSNTDAKQIFIPVFA